MRKYKRFVVGVEVGCIGNMLYNDDNFYVEYERHWFATLQEAEAFASNYPPGQTYIMDTENLPF